VTVSNLVEVSDSPQAPHKEAQLTPFVPPEGN